MGTTISTTRHAVLPARGQLTASTRIAGGVDLKETLITLQGAILLTGDLATMAAPN